MPNPIKPRRSHTAGAIPTTSDLAANELGINWADGKFFTKHPTTGEIVAIVAGGGGGGSGEDSLLRSLFLPPAPTSVTATGGDGQAAVSWTAPTVLAQTPITDYVVQFQPSGGSWTTFADGTSTSASAAVTGLTNGTTYSFRVAAVNAVGQGAWSTASSGVTPSSVVSQYVPIPAMTSATTPSGTVSSDGIPENQNAQFEPWTLFDGNPSSAPWYSGTTSSETPLPLPHWVQYDFGGNVRSAISGYTINPFCEFGPDRRPTAWTFSGSNDGVTFTTLDTRTGAMACDVPTSYTLAAPAAYRIYRWTFTAVDNAVGLVNLRSLGLIPGGPLLAPTSLTAFSGDGSVSLQWTAPAHDGGSAITDYIVQYQPSGGSWETFSDGTSTSTSATVTGLNNGTAYSFRVAAVTSAATSGYSNTATATPAQSAILTITEQPKNNFSTTSSDSASFSVTASLSGGAVSYQWQAYAYDGNYELNWQNIPNATSSTFSVSPAGWAANTGLNIDYLIDVRLRCVVTGSGNAGSWTITTSEARWVLLANINRYLDVYGDSGTFPNGASTIGGQSFSTISMQSGESLTLYADDPYSGLDTTWYSSNAYTVKVQSSPDGSTWAEAYTPVNLRSAFSVNQPIAPQAAGTYYYRVLLVANWPFTTTNGTQSSSRSAPEIVIGGAVATW